MNEQLLSRSWRTILLVQLAFLFVSSTVFTLGLHSLSTVSSLANQQTVQNSAYPVKGDPGVVDYQQVDALVQQRVSELPKPKDGAPGHDGVNGQDGKPGNDGANGQDGVGVGGREVEMQANPLSGNLEWRYIGDDSWQLLIKKCQITDSCDVH